MASSTAVFYLRPPTSVAASFESYGSGAIFFLSLRFVSGLYSAGGGFQNDFASSSTNKTLFPRRDVPLVEADGRTITERWYRILQFMYEKKLGGDLAPTIKDVLNNVTAAQGAGIDQTSQIASIIQVIEANAAGQAVANEVAQSNATPGADQIPDPILTVPQPGIRRTVNP